LKQFIKGLARSTVDALEAGVIGKQDPDTGATILFSKAVEDVVDRGNVILYVDDGTGSIESTEVVSSENVTEGLLGPPPDSAVGGETELSLDFKPIKLSAGLTLTSSTRGTLTEDTGAGGDYVINPASGLIIFDPALVTAEVITADYTKYTGLIALAQKIIDGDPDDRTNFPGFRSAGVLVIVATPQVLLQNVTAIITVAEGFSNATVEAAVVAVIKDYINGLGISGDVVRNELIKRIQSVSGVLDHVLSVPATNIAILDDQLARTTDSNITVS
jgi:hypothetical protein